MDIDLSNTPGKIKTASLLKEKNKQEQLAHEKLEAVGKEKHDRLPPGQRLLTDKESLPVLDLGTRPDFDPATYRFEAAGLVSNALSWSWEEVLNKLPKVALTADFHCVTKWSQYDVNWAGIRYLDLEKLVEPLSQAKFVIQFGLDGYTTNVPIEDLRHDNVLLAYELKGQPLPREHGWPLRLIIPELYGWKGSKFLNKFEFVEKDDPGFWERRGYHNHGDPWLEERYG